jgi:CHAT domain-containing protein
VTAAGIAPIRLLLPLLAALGLIGAALAADPTPQAGLTDAAGPAEAYQRNVQELEALRRDIRRAYGTASEAILVPLLQRELAAGERMIRDARSWATDAQMHAVIQFADDDRDLLFSLLARRTSDLDLVKLGLEYEVTRKARFAREQVRAYSQWKLFVARERPDLWGELLQAQHRFTAAVVLPSLVGGYSRPRLDAAAAEVEQVQRKIFESAGLRRELSFATSSDILTDMGVDQLMANINFGKVLIVYVAYDELLHPLAIGAIKHGEPRYLAIVGHEGTPLRAIPLGLASAIEQSAGAFLGAAGNKPRGHAPFDAQTADALYRQIVAPLKPYFAYSDVHYSPELLISADGILLGIPFAALVEDGRFLIEKYQITPIESPGEANLLPRANLDPSTTLVALANPALARAASAKYKPLAQAEAEAEEIATLWPQGQKALLRGVQATTSALDASASDVGVIHIASHGMFAPGAAIPQARAISPQDVAADRSGLLASSLARSVVLLSPSPGRDESGLLSALDILRLDLSRTQLVVLSACDTNLGDQERGEGIYGLRRAALEAGAETVVSSLWEVDSAATRELMVAFYRNMFQGEGRAEALQHAAAFIRLKNQHPFYWASFVLTGNTGALKLPKPN